MDIFGAYVRRMHGHVHRVIGNSGIHFGGDSSKSYCDPHCFFFFFNTDSGSSMFTRATLHKDVDDGTQCITRVQSVFINAFIVPKV